MRFSGLALLPLILLSFSGKAFSHSYDSVGVEAGSHVHEEVQTELEIKDNCFIDPKLGPICK